MATNVSDTKQKRAALWIIPTIIVGALLVSIPLFWAMSSFSSNTRPVSVILMNVPDIEPRLNTEVLCEAALTDCVEGWSTNSGNFLQFSSVGAAKEYENYLGEDGRRWENIVLDMHGFDLTFEQKRSVIDVLNTAVDPY